MSDEANLSPVEHFKIASGHLRGEIPDELRDGTDHFGKGSVQLLKHHGTYQQDHRDARMDARAEGESGKFYMFMVRTRIPGGKLTSAQLLAELDLCDELGDSTLRVTSRQALQLHGVLKSNLQPTIRRINEVQLTTLGACGDVERNIMCCPAPYRSDVYDQVQRLADDLADHLAPRTRAYHELWLQDLETSERELVGGGLPGGGGSGGESGAAEGGDDVEPLYGKQYLPRKFKTAIGFPHDNCVDIYTHDLGLLAVVEDDQIVGYNVLVGGGQGVTPSAKKTFPALAKRMAFVTPEQVVETATAVIKVQRDHGNRSDRKVARLKYLIHNWGLPRFKAAVEEHLGYRLPDPHPADVTGFNDHMGWDEQGDGRWFYGLNVENGRLADRDSVRLKTAVRRICEQLQPGIRLTSHQSILFTNLAAEDRTPLMEILREHGVRTSEQTSTVRRWSMACVAWPTCGLAITESERALPGIIDELEPELARLGLSNEEFTIRMTGCPNGCARPYNSDVGLVGKAKDKYTVLIGGRLLGNRLNTIYKDLVPRSEVVPTLVPLLAYFKADRNPGETFGDFCHRKGNDDLLAWADNYTP